MRATAPTSTRYEAKEEFRKLAHDRSGRSRANAVRRHVAAVPLVHRHRPSPTSSARGPSRCIVDYHNITPTRVLRAAGSRTSRGSWRWAGASSQKLGRTARARPRRLGVQRAGTRRARLPRAPRSCRSCSTSPTLDVRRDATLARRLPDAARRRCRLAVRRPHRAQQGAARPGEGVRRVPARATTRSARLRLVGGSSSHAVRDRAAQVRRRARARPTPSTSPAR